MTEPGNASEISLLPVNPPEVDHKKNSNKRFRDLTDAEQLLIAHRVLENTTNNPLIGDVMARFGFDSKKMELFRVKYNEAEIAQSAQSKEYGERADAYAEFDKLFQTAKLDFSTLRKVAKVALKKNLEKLIYLKIDQQKKQSISGLLDQIKICYDNLLSDREIMQRLAEFGTSEEMIYGYQKNYQQTKIAYGHFYKEDSEAINATRIRDEKIDAVCDFLSDFFAISKIAFADQPDLLKQIS